VSDPLRVLLVEDDERDASLIIRALQLHGLDPHWECVDTADGMASALDRQDWDIVLAGYMVPGFGAVDALGMLSRRDRDLPLIVVSGIAGEETAVETMRAGARDYLLKENLARLGPAIERELAQVAVRRARHEAERLLRESSAQLRRVIECSPDVIVRIDEHLRITLAGPAVEQIAGSLASEVIGERIASLGYPPEHADRLERHTRRVISTGEPAVIEHEVPTVEGNRWFETRLIPEHDEDGRCGFALLASRDITHRKVVERELTRRSLHDPLTELPNRLLLEDRLMHAAARLGRGGPIVAVLSADVDRFKDVNDAHGREAGDEVLLQIARRLSGAVRSVDTVARVGGDHFVILLEGATDEGDVLAAAERVARSVAPPMTLEDGEVSVTISIGIATAREPTDPETLLHDADAAMYRAKQRGRSHCELFDEQIRALVQTRVALVHDLHSAIESSQLGVRFAPEFDLTEQRLVGADAVVLWEGPDRSLACIPDLTEPAGATVLGADVGAWLLAEACEAAAGWPVVISNGDLAAWVPVPPLLLRERSFTEKVQAVIAGSGLPPSRLGIEISESLLSDPDAPAYGYLTELSEMGVRIGIVGFGTGPSPLAYLRRLPVARVKIDASFLIPAGIDTDLERSPGPLAAATIAFIRSIGARCVATGVETLDDVSALEALGCNSAQGSFFGAAITGDEIVALLDGIPLDLTRDSSGHRAG